MWYFIPGNTEKIALLIRSKLSAAPMEIQTPTHLEGIGFPEEDAPKILEMLGLTGTPEKKPTDLDGIVLLVFPGAGLMQETPKPSVEICSWEGSVDLKRHFISVLKDRLMPIINKRIEVFVPHGSRVTPEKDDVFRVFIYSSCLENHKDMVETPSQIFRTRVHQTAPSFAPYAENGENFLVLDEFSGYVAAELMGNNLYIFHDVCHKGTSDELNIFRDIIRRTAEYLSFSEEDRNEIRRKIAEELTSGKIIVQQWRDDESGLKRFIAAIREILLPKINKDVVIHVPKCKVHLVEDGKFHIFIHSTLETEYGEMISPPEKIFGLGVDSSELAFTPASDQENSILIYDERSGYAVAQIIGNNMFIHHHICYEGSPREAEMFKRLLNASITDLSISPEERMEKERKRKEEKQRLEAEEEQRERDRLAPITARAKPLYVEACRNRLKTITHESEEAIRKNDKEIGMLGNKLISAARDATIAQKTISQLELQKAEAKESSEKEFDQIMQIPEIVGISIRERMLCVYTDSIKITHEENIYIIGHFRMEISFFSDKFSVSFINLSNRGKGPGFNLPKGFDGDVNLNRHHPCVDSKGTADLGKLAVELPLFLGENQFAMAISLLVKFLKRIDPKSRAALGLKWWPTEKEVAPATPPPKVKGKSRSKKKGYITVSESVAAA